MRLNKSLSKYHFQEQTFISQDNCVKRDVNVLKVPLRSLHVSKAQSLRIEGTKASLAKGNNTILVSAQKPIVNESSKPESEVKRYIDKVLKRRVYFTSRNNTEYKRCTGYSPLKNSLMSRYNPNENNLQSFKSIHASVLFYSLR
eukprot:TRINITY_DN12358_c0_g1_i3.p1 TRINITY_DN12358_c0_g1~~TRINITY_DN12358_c0_g1_i3.p1  ORF type:complete len:144 (+),score=13.82 TRINITY_DN12358_c0_g1_i3:102-533(+)